MTRWIMPTKELLDALEWKEMSIPPDSIGNRFWVRIQPKGETAFYAPCMIHMTERVFKVIGEDGFLLHTAPIEPHATHWALTTPETPTPRAYRVHHE